MPRFELGVITPVRFVAAIESVEDALEAPTISTEIEFDGHTFVWHDGGEEHDPVIAVEYEERPRARAEASELSQRLLSAIAYVTEATPVASFGWGLSSSERSAWHPPAARPPRSSRGLKRTLAPARVEVVRDRELRRALALLREGISSESPFYRFLCYWNALDIAAPHGQMSPLIDMLAPRYWKRHSTDPLPRAIADHFWEASRCAIAHAVRGGRPELDSDDPEDRMRLVRDTRVLYPVLRDAFARAWPDGVRFVYSREA